MKFLKIANEYIRFAETKGKPQSIRSIKSRINNYIIPYFKEYNIKDINPSIYLEWQNTINKNNFSFKYKKTLHYTMVSIFNFANKFYSYDNNIASKVGNFSNSYNIPKEIDVWSNDEFNQFIKYVKEPVYKTLFTFMFYTGCRLGECLALNFNDLNDNIININKTISKEFINGKRQITTPKTKKSIRKIHIDSLLKIELNNLKNYYMTNIGYFKNNFYIFGGLKPLSPTTINRYKIKACEKANLKPIKLHEFRHSHATMLVEKKLMIKEISRRLGHSDSNITLNVYTHATNEHEKKVIKTLNFLRLFY